MGMRFRKSFKVAPGVRVNVGKKSVGVSAGVKGAHISASTSGRKSASVGIPGTGISYTKSLGGGKSTQRSTEYVYANAEAVTRKPGLRWWQILLLVIFYPVGICYLIYWLIWGRKKGAAAPVESAVRPATMEFPEFDSTGHRRLTLVSEALSGITHKRFGSDPQEVIPTLAEGEQLILHADPENEYDKFAVWVATTGGQYIGWIPTGRNFEVFERLTTGQTVLARVKRVDELDGPDEDDPTFGCIIEIAKYSKAVPKQ